MLTKIAWKNIWRSPVRSLILISAVALGIWALIFINGVSKGVSTGYVENAIKNRTSHIQIHNPAYEDEPLINHFFNSAAVDSFLVHQESVQGYTKRIIANGMISSPKSTRGIVLYGVDPDKENTITGLSEKIIEGDSLISSIRNPLLINKSLAKKLGVKIRSKVVIKFQNVNSQVTAAAFRVAGFLHNTAGKSNENIAYLPRDLLQDLTAVDTDQIHEIAVIAKDLNRINEIQEKLKSSFPLLSVKNYKEISPDVALMSSQINVSLTVMVVIFMLALIFGIINTMLMAVLERYKELGMLLAVGMKKMQLFKMVVLETIFLSMVGVPVGLVMGKITIVITHSYGINLERWAAGLNEIGMLSTIYPSLPLQNYINIALSVLVTAILASIYPARKATSLNPIQALRKI